MIQVEHSNGIAQGEERNQRILIIDDNMAIHEDVRKILGVPSREDAALDMEAAALFDTEPEMLASVEFEIDSAFQGEEGLEMVQKALDEGRPYAMAFVDVRMPPGWDGIETIGRIWKAYPELQVVICTAYSDYSWEDMIRHIGKTDSLVILKKPFDNVEVLQLAHTLTQKWTLSHRLKCHLEGLDRIVARRTEELQSANARLRREVEEREQAERELSQSEERFAKAFQASPIPMAIQSLATERYIDVNDAFLSIVGFRRLEIISHTPAELEIAGDAEADSRVFELLRQTGSVRNVECQVHTRVDGVRECIRFAETFELGMEKVALVATLDVSEQRRLEKKLRHSQKLEAVGQLAAGVAHDFNNILTVIQGHATRRLASASIEKEMAESFKQVSLAAERAAALTRQLLAFSRKQIVQPKVLNFNAVVCNLQDMLRRVIGEDITLLCKLSENLPNSFADEANLEQIVMNLVVNARDAMPNGGRLTIQTEVIGVDAASAASHPNAAEGRYICASFTDDGCGMSRETLSHIFEPFFTTKEVGKGTGLGLATVYGIIAQHDGWIDVTSEIGSGTTFHVYLPVTDENTESVSSDESTELRGGTETILLVEDEPDVREIAVDILRHHGYAVIPAADGPEALQLWSEKSGEIDLLVTDIVMPNGLKGNVLAKLLQAEKPALKVIFSSGYSAEFTTESSTLNQRIKFLQKPYKLEVLVKSVRDSLDYVN